MSSESHMHGGGESNSGVVPTKQPNQGGEPPAEGAEGRPLTKESMGQSHSGRTPSRESEPKGLDRVREAARRDGKMRFTALLHQGTLDLLRDSYHGWQKRAAPGAEGVTWKEYGEGLEERWRDLPGRIHRGAYRAQPTRRVWIPKADGRQRPWGIAALTSVLLAGSNFSAGVTFSSPGITLRGPLGPITTNSSGTQFQTANVHVAADAALGPTNIYYGSSSYTGGLEITVHPAIGQGGVVDAAAFKGAYALGSMIAIFGADLAEKLLDSRCPRDWAA